MLDPLRRPSPARTFLACGAAWLLLHASCQGGGGTAPDGGLGGAPGGHGGQGGTTIFSSVGAGGMGPEAGCAGDAAADAGADASTGCEGLEGGVDYKTEVAHILVGCQGENCHFAPTPESMIGKPAYQCCDGRALVAPGDAAHSYLIDKVTGHDMCSGLPMPRNLPALPDADVLTLRRWICEGAPSL